MNRDCRSPIGRRIPSPVNAGFESNAFHLSLYFLSSSLNDHGKNRRAYAMYGCFMVWNALIALSRGTVERWSGKRLCGVMGLNAAMWMC